MDGSVLASPGQPVEIAGVRFMLELVGGRIKVIPLPPACYVEPRARMSGSLRDRVSSALTNRDHED